MALNLESILAAAIKLPPEERALLAEEMWASLPDQDALPFDEAWVAEVDRRSKEIDSGACELLSWEEVKRRARDSVGE